MTNLELNSDSFYQLCEFATISTTHQEYRELVSLRYRAYANARKLKPGTIVPDMADDYDSVASIIIARYQGMIVGSVRVTIPEECRQSYYGKFFSEPAQGLPNQDEYAEASRLCIDPHFQRKKLFYYLAAHMIVKGLETGREYLVGGATADLLPIWDSCGFRSVGAHYIDETLAPVQHTLMLMDLSAVSRGEGISIRVRDYLFSLQRRQSHVNNTHRLLVI